MTYCMGFAAHTEALLYSFQNRAFLIRMTYGCLFKGVCPKLSVYDNLSEYDTEMDF